jgi:hypothetical protein
MCNPIKSKIQIFQKGGMQEFFTNRLHTYGEGEKKRASPAPPKPKRRQSFPENPGITETGGILI